MAIIAVPTFLDGGTARTAGETWTINSGGSLTIRSDTRVHANAPASFTGALSNVTINEGALYWDSSAVRWMPYNSGTGNVPAIGTNVTQGAVSGYLLGVWASKTVQATAVGSAMPTTGFIKFRSVTGGSFAAGALSGIGASSTGADVQGWISLAHDVNTTFTVPRLGLHQARGGRFYLETTTGVRGQVFQVPSEGSSAMFAPGLMVETGVGTDEYEFWPALGGATPANNGWAHQHIGEASSWTDIRQRYLKATAGGGMVMGETFTLSGTYASLAAQASTYAAVNQTCTYTWANDLVEVYFATGHQLETGQQTGLDFTSGGATAYDGIYTVTVLDPYRFTVPLLGSGAGGNVTSRPGVTISFTSHLQNIGDRVYCDFTTGTGVDGTYEIYMVATSGAYTIKYPHTTAITSGNVSVLHSLTLTLTGHALSVGQRIYCNFTSGGATISTYTVKTVVDANNVRINYPHSAVIATSNVIIGKYLGHVAPAGCRTWIGSNILNECATAARNINTIANAAIANRPEWATTSAGAIDLEYVYGCSGYLNASQAYSMRLRNCFFPDAAIINECATALDIDGLYFGMCTGLDANVPLTLNNNYAGGLVKNVKACRGSLPGTSDHAITVNYCFDLTLDNCEGTIIQYTRSTGYFYIGNCSRVTLTNCRALNTRLQIDGSPNTTVTNFDRCERISGYGLGAQTAIVFGANSHNSVVDGVTFGYGGLVPNQDPYSVVNITASNNVKIRNVGTYASPIPKPIWAPNLTCMQYIVDSGGANNGIKVQRCYTETVRSAQWITTNADKNMTFEHVCGGMYAWTTRGITQLAHADLNGVYKGIQNTNTTNGQASVYGTHWADMFTGVSYGRLFLQFNEPTSDTAPQFTMVSGVTKFNSSGGLLMAVIGDQCIWEMNYFAQGHTGFVNTAPTMVGGTITNYTVEYQIDVGSGYNGTWLTLNGTNLSSHSITPTVGFKMKIRITTILTNTTAITSIRVDTTTSTAAQASVSYPLDTNTVTFTGLPLNTDMVVLEAGTTNVLYQVDSYGNTSIPYTYSGADTVDVGFIKPGYKVQYIRNLAISTNDTSLPVTLEIDRNYT